MKKVFLLMVAVIVVAAIIMYSSAKPTPPPDLSVNVGKHAYNRTNGVYRGEILKVKACKTELHMTCFVVNQPSYTNPMEAPVDNVDVREEAPNSTP